ncbi:hypothetical protein BGZ76_010912 [Entomortierella beljakovae]|nr:hypothetical protein BGZ76_010912 [Entomortierella beljakovae]
MNTSEADSVLQQQSKRLAGLSITNATGTKFSILNDNSTEVETSPTQQSTPHSPFSSSREEYFQPHSSHYKSSKRNHHTDTIYETGRSSSLTNASTPTYSCLESGTSKSSSKSLAISSIRSRSLSSGSALSPAINSASCNNTTSSATSPIFPFFSRSYSEDNQSDDSESYRRMSEPNAANASGPAFVKRKYTCTFPGCNKCFTTSGHLARHNRIHTGERNFACLMPGCPSKFSRQDNMMQHYRTHISPKSRRGTTKKDGQPLNGSVNNSQESLSGREHSPTVNYFGNEYEQHHTKMGGSRQGSRQNSPPRFNPFDRSSSVEYSARHSSENLGNNNGLRHKKSGVIQAHQHHTPMPHFNVQGVTTSHESQNNYPQSSLPSPLTPTISHISTYYNQPAYVPPMSHSSNKHSADIPNSPNGRYRSEVLASPTSPMTLDVERMEGMSPVLDYDRYFYKQQQQYQHHQSSSRSMHAGHAQQTQRQNNYQLPPLSLHAQDRKVFDKPVNSHLSMAAPPSPQSTPHTPTKYRFDPIQDCIQQEKEQQQQQQRERYDQREHSGADYRSNSHHSMQNRADDTDMPSGAHASVISPSSSMASISPSPSTSSPLKVQYSEDGQRQESEEEMSGLAHLAQIVTTYG